MEGASYPRANYRGTGGEMVICVVLRRDTGVWGMGRLRGAAEGLPSFVQLCTCVQSRTANLHFAHANHRIQ